MSGARAQATMTRLHSDRPSLPDLFPPESEFAGDPLPGSAL